MLIRITATTTLFFMRFKSEQFLISVIMNNGQEVNYEKIILSTGWFDPDMDTYFLKRSIPLSGQRSNA